MSHILQVKLNFYFGRLEQWAADTVAHGEQLEVRCLAQGSHLSRGHFLPELRFEPTTSGYKSNALSTRPRLPICMHIGVAEAEKPACFSMCVVNETMRLHHSFTQRHAEHAELILKFYFCGLLFTDTSPYCIFICVLT